MGISNWFQWSTYLIEIKLEPSSSERLEKKVPNSRIPNQPLVSAGILYTQSKKPQFNYLLRVTLGIP